MKKKLFPVIHPLHFAQVINQAELCKNAGVDGIFLINQGHLKSGHFYSDFMKLIDTAARVKQLFDMWVGINILDKNPFFVAPLLTYYGIDGYWTDTDESYHVRKISDCAWDIDFVPNYYPSFDFKYQDQTKEKSDLRNDIEAALRLGYLWATEMVITTSGPATGTPPDIEKIKWFREVIGPDVTLAIASGINLENIESFLPYVDHFLVASSLEDEYGRFNEDRLKQMVSIVKSYNEKECK